MVDVTSTERDALHELQLGVEHVYRAYGHLLAFHHSLGHGMDHLDDAESLLRTADHSAHADKLRDHHLPAGAIDDRWTYELVEEFRYGLLAGVNDFESAVRDDVAGGVQHVTEREQQRQWQARAGDDE